MATKLEHVSEDTRDELAQLALRLSGNAKTRKGFLGLVKEASPDTPIPELDAVAWGEKELAARDKRIQELEGKLNDVVLGGQMVEQKRQIMSKHGLSEADLTTMEERMGKKELPTDYEFAARLFKQEKEVAPPTTYGTSGYGPFNLRKGAEEMKGLMDDEVGRANDTAHSIIDEMQKTGRSPAF